MLILFWIAAILSSVTCFILGRQFERLDWMEMVDAGILVMRKQKKPIVLTNVEYKRI